MNAQSHKMTQLAAAIVMAMAYGSAGAAGNDITLEQAVSSGNNGTGNYANITATGTNDNAVSIYQIGSGSGADDGTRNQVGTSTTKLTIGGTGGIAAHIGQGGFYDTSWHTSRATTGNVVKGSITGGTVTTSQNSSGKADGSLQNVIDLTVSNGTVTVNQGHANGTPTSAANTSFTATVTQTGTGAVTINQGNAASSAATTGTATVTHAGAHSVSITQTDGTNTDMGTVLTKTDGGSADDALSITQSNAGTIYVTADGTASGGTATIAGDATLDHTGVGTIGLTGVGEGADVIATVNVATGKTLLMTQGAGGHLYVTDDGTSTGGRATISGNATLNNLGGTMGLKGVATGSTVTAIANTTGGSLIMDSAGTGSNTLTISQDSTGTGTAMTIAGTLAINQTGNNSTLALGGSMGTGIVTLNQTGAYQDATVTAANGSSGTFTLAESGASGARSTINLTY